MPEEATAVMEREAAEASTETAPPIEATKTIQDAGTETERDQKTTETEQSEEDQRFTEKDLRARLDEQKRQLNEAHKKALEEREQEARGKAEQEAYERERAVAYQELQGGLLNRLHSMSNEVAEAIRKDIEAGGKGELTFNVRRLQQEIQNVVPALALSNFESFAEAMTRELKLPDSANAAIERAMRKRDPRDVVKAFAAALRDPLRDEIRTEIEAETAEKSRLDQERETEARKRETPGPTNVSGKGTATLSARQTLDTAKPGTSAYNAAFRAVHGIDPP